MQIRKNNIKAVCHAVLMLVLIICMSACGSTDIRVETSRDNTSEHVTDVETDSQSRDGTDTRSTDDSDTDSAVNSVGESDSQYLDAAAPDLIKVYICGAVESEGVYELSDDSRVQDALDMAGGYSPEAFRGYVNLAERLYDGEKVYIPTTEEVESGVPGVAETFASDGTGEALIDINHADKELLMTLPGIGASKAEDIIAYRDSSGGFGAVQDITQVSGIGDATYSKLKDKITVN